MNNNNNKLIKTIENDLIELQSLKLRMENTIELIKNNIYRLKRNIINNNNNNNNHNKKLKTNNDNINADISKPNLFELIEEESEYQSQENSNNNNNNNTNLKFYHSLFDDSEEENNYKKEPISLSLSFED